MTNLDDATLVAFVDGELNAVSARAVTLALALDVAAQEKVRLLRASASLVRQAFAAEEPVPPALIAFVKRKPRWPNRLSRRSFGRLTVPAVAACAGIGAGFGVSHLLQPGPVERLFAAVAEYQTAYAGDDGPLDIAPASDAPRIAAWFSDVLGRPVRIPNLGSFGLAFRGARLLAAGGRPIAQFLYADEDAPRHPLGVCLTAWRAADHTLTIERRDGVTLALWARGGYAYVLVGWVDPRELRRIAAAVRPVLDTV